MNKQFVEFHQVTFLIYYTLLLARATWESLYDLLRFLWVFASDPIVVKSLNESKIMSLRTVKLINIS